MKFLTLMREYFSVVGLQKLQTANIAFPTAEKILPFYITFMSGFVVATALGFVAAVNLMPKPPVAAVRGEDGGAVDSVTLTLPDKPRDSDFTWIIKRNIFDSSGVTEDSKKSTCELVKSQLPIRFTGVIYGGSPETSLILLESSATKQADTFLVGDSVPGEAKIIGIERTRVIFQRNSCPEFLDLEEPPPLKKRMAGVKPSRKAGKTLAATEGGQYREDGFEREGTTVKATRQWVEKAVTVDFTKTLQDAKASPNIVNGEVKGFVLTRIRPDSVYEKMGLQDGDVVEAINGIELNDAARAIQTLQALRNEGNIDLQIKRAGSTQNMKLQVR